VSELWLPGPHDSFVEGLHREIERFGAEHGAAVVEVELREGTTVQVSAVSAEPGSGFVSLTAAADEPRVLVVPLVSIVRIELRATDDDHPLGFAVPPPT
jgi:hypothetical protein